MLALSSRNARMDNGGDSSGTYDAPSCAIAAVLRAEAPAEGEDGLSVACPTMPRIEPSFLKVGNLSIDSNSAMRLPNISM